MSSGRIEKRILKTVAVQLAADPHSLPAELTFTENISPRGARVRTQRPWPMQEHLLFRSLPGDFRSIARVTYCQQVSQQEYAIGLEFLQPSGIWNLNPPTPSGDS